MADWEHQPCGKIISQKSRPFHCDFCWMLSRDTSSGWHHASETPKKLIRQARYGKGKISQLRRESVYERDGNACVACGSTDDLTLDHKIPRSRGGTNAEENLQTMCKPCNAEKANKLPNLDKSAVATIYVLRSGTRPLDTPVAA